MGKKNTKSSRSKQSKGLTEDVSQTTVVQAPSYVVKPRSGDVFPIVGIGASAGGLNALKEFFAHVAEDTGFAFVVVVHLSPDHESHLPELLQPHVSMPVSQVTTTVSLERNHVYVIPPNSNLDAIDTHLRLTELEERRQARAPVDHFFRTLAKSHGDTAIGIVLSGTGSDGTLGLREIKEHGGLTIAQEPIEAQFDGMPQSAIASGNADLVLPLAQMPLAVLHYIRTRPKLPPTDSAEVDGQLSRVLQKIFAQLRARSGRDFTTYKSSTILRRIQRRMQMRQMEEIADYLELLRQQPDEAMALADDLLITVTSFFRDPEVFEMLQRDVIPQMFDKKTSDDEIRIWTVGCATGEEAYSLAMLVLDEASRRDSIPRVQVFASDLHEHSLQKAREGFYPGDIEIDVPPERLKRYFAKENGGYRIRKEVRELVIFAPHNLFADPPFSRLDMISCRNLMIYIQRDVQHDVIELFHYALRPEGMLLLGAAETIEGTELFSVVDKRCSIYRKRNVPVSEPRLPVFPLVPPGAMTKLPYVSREAEAVAFGALHQRMVERYAPPSVLVSPDDKIVHFSEHAGRYLVHPGGELTANVYKLVREELRIELRSILHDAREKGEAKQSKPIRVRFNGESQEVVLHVRPVPGGEQEGLALVIFDERKEQSEQPRQPTRRADLSTERSAARERELEAELDLVKQRLQAIVEEYESSKEEMKASNEEMQSSNEELRSTMEELETSKEELQSMNEELQTVNQENRHKVAELAQLTGDLQNFLSATQIATLFLDRDLRIVRFTPKVEELFNIRMTDRNRPITDLTNRLGYKELAEDARLVLQSLTPIEREVEDESGRWYMTRIMPYRSVEDRIDGVVITLVDISERKAAENEIRAAKERAEHIIEALPEPLLILTPDLRVKSANLAFYQHFRVKENEITGRKIYELGNGQWDIPDLRKLLEEVLPDNKIFTNFEVHHVFEEIGARHMLLNARQLEPMQLILIGILDVTEHFQTQAALQEADRRKDEFLAILAHELRNPLAPICMGLELLKLGDGAETFEEIRDTMERQTKQLVTLVDDLLDVSRITRGKLDLKIATVELTEVLKIAIEASRPFIDEAGHDLTVSLPEKTIHLAADPNRLAQIVSNLLINAAKYTNPGGHIRLSATRTNGEVIISVKDTGMGIPPDMLDRVFEMFSQIDRPNERGGTGLGIGLTLVKSLVEMHGGTIHVRSEGTNKGTEFTIRLPIMSEPASPLQPTTETNDEPVTKTSRRVLVVDDNSDAATVLSMVIRKMGNEVRVAADGEQALQIAAEFRPELILMDLGMPNMNGYETAQEIRKQQWGKEIKLVALTGWGQDEDRRRTQEAGFDHHLVKPADPKELRDLFAGLAGKWPRGRGNSGSSV